MIRIELFGGLRVRVGDRVVTRFLTRKTAALLANLAFYLGRAQPREVLIELLWPESDLAAGRKSLSVALSAIRREIESGEGPPLLRSDHFTLSLDSSRVCTDVQEFEHALDEAGRTEEEDRKLVLMRKAAELYQGQLLPGFYEEWIPPEQARLAGRYEDALLELTQRLVARGDPSPALDYARRVVALDPLREEAHRELIRLYARCGRISDAVRQYQELEQILRRELGSLPSTVTRALFAEITRGPQELGPAPLSPERDPAAVSPRAVRATAADSGRPGTCLPSRWSLFVGREGERIRLAKLLRPGQARLVTLTGPGGSGKTRLALEAARSMVSAYDSAVWFVPLADLADPRSIPQRICQSLGLALSPGEDALARVAQALGGEAGEPGLLVLDNLEHLIGEGGAILVGLLERLPQLTCLVTSRIRLNLAGEREFPIPPLAVPEPGADLETLLACDSVCLFVDRAQSVRPGFEVTERNAAAVLALCQRLDGIPLALELAAARAQVLTPAQMVEQLVHGSDFLVSHRRDAEARHRSLQAAVEWSFQLLEPEVQRYFVAFSIFRGGWSLEAASAVTVPVLMPESAGEADAPQVRARVLEALSRLCECSLVVADELDGKMRYRMLETLREYAQARLTAEERVQLHRAHLSWCQSVVDQVGMVSRGDSESGGMELIDPESENLWAALDWCRGPAGDVEAGIRLAACLGVYWYTRGDILRARECLLSLLARPETAAPTVWRAAALNAAGVMLTCQGDDQEAVPRFEEALELGRQLGHRGVTTHALSRLARISHRRGEFDRARALFEEALEIKRKAGDVAGFASILASLGHIARVKGEFTAARGYYQEALEFSRSTQDVRCAAMAMDCLARCDRDEGDLRRARELHLEALAIRQRVGDKPGRAISLGNLSLVAIRAGEYDEAARFLAESLEIMQAIGDPSGIASCLWARARVAACRKEWTGAADLYRQSLRLRSRLDHLGETLESLEGLAEVAAATGDLHTAVRLLGAAEATCRRLGIVLTPEYQETRRSIRERAVATLGRPEADAAWAAGTELGLADAVALALGPEE